MSGITSSGLISGIDSAALIDQLLQITARPRTLAQARLGQLQTQQAAFLDINSRLQTLRTAAADFRTQFVFRGKTATTTQPSAVTATANNGAQLGTFGVLVDRLVSTQQRLSRGFEDRGSSPFGAEAITFEPDAARLTRDVSLNELNGGGGVSRGVITIRDDQNVTATVDLSRVATVNEVLDAINNAGTNVRARVDGGAFVLDNVAFVESNTGFTTAEDLGLTGSIVGGTLTGATVYRLDESTLLSELNDGNGVDIRRSDDFSFAIDVSVGGGAATEVRVNLGEIRADTDPAAAGLELVEARVTTVGGVVDRINDALTAAGFSTRAAINESTGRLTITNGGTETVTVRDRDGRGTARDLGIRGLAGAGGATLSGARILSSLSSTLIKSVGGGGSGALGGNGELGFRLRDGVTSVVLNIASAETIEEAVEQINAAGVAQAGGRLTARVNDAGTGLEIADSTANPSANLISLGNPASDTATALGIATSVTGVAASTYTASAERRYLSEGTLLATLNGGRGIGSGTFTITGPGSITRTVSVGANLTTVRDLLDEFNATPGVSARINDTGDGFVIESTEAGEAIRITDTSGNVAEGLGIEGVGTVDGNTSRIVGGLSRTVEFAADDTLDEAVAKINEAGVGLTVSVLNDGSAARPFRLSFSATRTGEGGRVTIDTKGFNLGLQTLDEGRNARAFVGGSDPARSLLVSSSTNTLDGVVNGVNLDLKERTTTFAQVTVAQDTARIEESITTLVDAYNATIDRIATQSRYVEATNERGPLLGDGTLIGLQGALASVVNTRNQGFSTQFDRLTQVGITVANGGRLSFDSTRFRNALAEDPEAVEDLFTRRTPIANTGVLVTDENGRTLASSTDSQAPLQFSQLGVIGQIERLADLYTNSIDGVLTRRRTSLDSQISGQQERITNLGVSIENERQRLQRQFIALEQALAQLQSQQSALAGIGGGR